MQKPEKFDPQINDFIWKHKKNARWKERRNKQKLNIFSKPEIKVQIQVICFLLICESFVAL